MEHECEGLQYQVEVRNITQKISSLTEKLDSVSTLSDPRENSFLTCDFQNSKSASSKSEDDISESLNIIRNALESFGKVRTSTTFPSLCTATVDESGSGGVVARLQSSATLTTLDYHGNPRTTGGDPVSAELQSESGECIDTQIEDREDGSYRITFRPPLSGRYVLRISVFQRPIRDNPLFFDVTDHNSPTAEHGSRGSGKSEFLQPVAVTVDYDASSVYVLDTGNSRIKVLTLELEFVRHIENDGLKGRSCTGIAMSKQGLVVVNWRTKTVTEINPETGDTIKSFTHNAFQEPVDVAVLPGNGRILVADNSASCVFVFDESGHLMHQVGRKGSQRGQFNLISSVAAAPNDNILVADSRIQIFSPEGEFIREVFPEGKGNSYSFVSNKNFIL